MWFSTFLDYLGKRSTAALPNPHDRDFANGSASSTTLRLPFVGIQTADERLIRFDNAAKLVIGSTRRPAGLAEPSKHKPSRLLSDADLFSQLKARDTFTGRDQQVHGIDPLVQRNLRALENGVCANREIELAREAPIEPRLARGARTKGRYAVSRLAIGADRAIGPETTFEVGPRRLLIGKQREQLKCADGGFAHGLVIRHPERLHRTQRIGDLIGTADRRIHFKSLLFGIPLDD